MSLGKSTEEKAMLVDISREIDWILLILLIFKMEIRYQSLKVIWSIKLLNNIGTLQFLASKEHLLIISDDDNSSGGKDDDDDVKKYQESFEMRKGWFGVIYLGLYEHLPKSMVSCSAIPT